LREIEAPTFSDIRLRDGGKVVSPGRFLVLIFVGDPALELQRPSASASWDATLQTFREEQIAFIFRKQENGQLNLRA
jgi:hypothetical protein